MEYLHCRYFEGLEESAECEAAMVVISDLNIGLPKAYLRLFGIRPVLCQELRGFF